MKRIFLTIILTIVLGACAQHRWVAGPYVAGDYNRVSGQCKLVAMGAPSGGFVGAAGNPKFVGAVVGGAILVGAVSSAIHQQHVYNACMESAGFIAEDTAATQ